MQLFIKPECDVFMQQLDFETFRSRHHEYCQKSNSIVIWLYQLSFPYLRKTVITYLQWSTTTPHWRVTIIKPAAHRIIPICVCRSKVINDVLLHKMLYRCCHSSRRPLTRNASRIKAKNTPSRDQMSSIRRNSSSITNQICSQANCIIVFGTFSMATHCFWY